MDERKNQIMGVGRHLILELYDCDAEKLNDLRLLEQSLCEAADAMGATILSSNFHPFSPIGASGIVLIKESHLSIHTWPEYNYAAIDIFTCGNMDMEAGIEILSANLLAQRSEVKILQRGVQIENNKFSS